MIIREIDVHYHGNGEALGEKFEYGIILRKAAQSGHRESRGDYEQTAAVVLWLHTLAFSPFVIFIFNGVKYPVLLLFLVQDGGIIAAEHDYLFYPVIFTIFHSIGKSQTAREVVGALLSSACHCAFTLKDNVGKRFVVKIDVAYRQPALRY